MKTYCVLVREVHVNPKQVTASSEADALKQVSNGEGHDLDNGLEYSHTLPPETWTVEPRPSALT